MKQKDRNVEDIYPLTPTQEGILFHTLAQPDDPVYQDQFQFQIDGELELKAFSAAWHKVVDRHPALRTLFIWKNRARPLQVVRRQVNLPIRYHDWQQHTGDQQQEALRRFLEVDRLQGFELNKAPLMRLALFRTGRRRHEFVWTYHYLLLDGWSLPIIFKDFLRFYEAAHALRDTPLDPGPEFREHVRWLQQQDLRLARAFWSEWLAGFTAPTQIRISRTDSDQEDPLGSAEAILPPPVVDRLEALARAERLTLNTLAQGAWAMLLSGYSGEQDLVFGVTLSGRPPGLERVEECVGLFINTLPLRVRISATRPAARWLRDLQLAFQEVQQFSYSPLKKVQEWSEIRRGHALFESILVFSNYPMEMPFLQDIGVSIRLSNLRTHQSTHYPLTMLVIPGEQWLLRIYYQKTQFDPADIHRMLEHMASIFAGLAETPGRPPAWIPMLTRSERADLQHSWAGSARPYPKHSLVTQHIERISRSAPQATALVSGSEKLSYLELEQKANRLAHAIRARGIEADQVVGVCLSRSPEMIAAMLAILKSGAAYLPLDPDYPPARLHWMARDAGAVVVITDRKHLAIFAGQSIPLMNLDRDRAQHKDHPATPPPLTLSPQNLAYVIYTSGSTGKPKGVAIPHRGLLNLCFWHLRAFRIEAADQATHLAALSFDASVWEIWPYLMRGATIHLPAEAILADPEALVDWLVESDITICFLPTPIAERVLTLIWPAHTRLRTLLTGGDRLTLRPPSGLPFALINNYGPTECSVVSHSGQVQSANLVEYPAIGAAVDNIRGYVLDPNLMPVPIGLPGELYLAGDGLARGYLGQPGLTAERFLPDAFGSIPGARMYRTGDTVRQRPDGSLEFIGRRDSQVKIRGFRVELGEIETALRKHPAIEEAVVLAQASAMGARRLVGYVRYTAQTEPDPGSLKAELGERLPEHMLPAAIIPVASIPLTANGKVDRRRLPDPGGTIRADTQEQDHPKDVRQQALQKIWRQVLGLDNVGIHDNFFELGGDSILSIHVASQATQAGIGLSPSDLFAHQTIAAQAAAARSRRNIRPDRPPSGESIPLTPIQHWFFEQELADRQHFNMPAVLRLAPDTDIRRLEAALDATVDYHDAFRFRYLQRQERWVQSIAEQAAKVRFQEFDFTNLDADQQFQDLRQAAAELQGQLDLQSGPLLRGACFHCAPEAGGSRLLLVAHHLIMDAVSWQIILSDIQTAYRQLAAGDSIELPPVPTSFRQWAQELSAFAGSPKARSEHSYWTAGMDHPVQPIPLDSQRHKEPILVASTRKVVVDLSVQDTDDLLRMAPAALGVELSDMLLTALVQTLSAWSAAQQVWIRMEAHGREPVVAEIDLSRTVGWFTTLFPVCFRLPDSDQPIDQLKAVKETLRKVPNRGIGFGVLRYLDPDPAVRADLAALPRPPVSFLYLGQLDRMTAGTEIFDLVQEELGPAVHPGGRRRHLLEVIAWVSGGRLHTEWQYSSALHREGTIRELAEGCQTSLRSLLSLARSAGEKAFTPADFPAARLDQQQLDRFLGQMRSKR